MSSETPNSGQAKPPIPTPAKKVPAWNIEKRNDRLYEVTTLHKWFAISSLLLFVFTVVMILADYSREWKRYQREFTRFSIDRATQDKNKAAGTIDRNKYAQFQNELAAAQKLIDQNAAAIAPLQKKLDSLNADFYRIDNDLKSAKAYYGTDRYTLDEAVAAAAKDPRKQPEADRARKVLDKDEKAMSELQAKRDDLTLQIAATKSELEKYIGKRDEAVKGKETTLANYNRVKGQLKH